MSKVENKEVNTKVATKATTKTVAKKEAVTEVKKYNVHEALVLIQTTLNAPKNLRNSFGNFNYRNAEGILNSAKPLLKETNCTVVLDDDITLIGDRYYFISTATLKDSEGNVEVARGFAREEDFKKGMDAAMVSGSTSSYSRKYALNALFAIDDSKDPDSDEFQSQKEKASQAEAKSAPKEAVQPNTKPWLNKTDEKITTIIEGLKSGKFTVDAIKETRSISKSFETELRKYEKGV